MKLILDGPRMLGTKVVRKVFSMAMEDRTGRVVGVGLGGDEKRSPARLFSDEFAYARAAGLKNIAHAGETDGVDSMLDAILLLNVSRIGHGLGIPLPGTTSPPASLPPSKTTRCPNTSEETIPSP
ncbi:MAG: hypothetical protein GY866_02140 [Proteobacteria bacterium]|nr:hypothetical protein [Pseudomonadota bacterium]